MHGGGSGSESSYDDGGVAASAADSPAGGAPNAALRGRVCLVTGANRGIGRATAAALARLGATVVMLARDARLAAAAREAVARESGNERVSVVPADLASFSSIRAAAGEVAARFEAVHVLVNNAGVNLARRQVSADGVELTLAVNHLAPFLLTHELLPLLRRGAADGGARVVTVTSEFERFGRVAFGNLQGERRYVGLLAYTQSKLANVLFTYELAARLAGTGVTANCVYPGLVATDLMRDRLLFRAPWLRALWGRVLLSPEAGAKASVYAASAPEVRGATGRCFDRRGREVRTSRRSYEAAARERLWRVSEELTGVGSGGATV
jgi:NAD(P)-dependent dehydrogenase (short-subunit alcohol dehydrogenase family)